MANAAEKAIDGANRFARDTAREASRVSADVSDATVGGIDRLKDTVIESPLKSVMIAAGLGYIAAILMR